MEGAHPTDLMRTDPLGGSRHAFRAKIGAIRQHAGEHGGDVLRRIPCPDMRELICKSSPLMHLPEKVGHFDQRIHFADFDVQLIRCGGNIARPRRYDQGSSLQPDAIELSIAHAISKALEIEVHRLPHFGEPRGAIALYAETELAFFLHGEERGLGHEVFVYRPE